MKGFDKTNRSHRRHVVTEAIANNRLAGLELHPDDAALFERFVEGEITLEEVRRVIEEQYPQKK